MKGPVTPLICSVAALLALGMVVLFSADMTQEGGRYLTQQLMWCGLGLGACLIATLMDYHFLKKLVIPLLIIAVIMLVYVLIFGQTIKGARRWIKLGSLAFQPSEFAKLAGIIALAAYAEFYQRRMDTLKYGIVIPGVGLVILLLLIFAGHDYGTTLLFATVSGIMLLVAGVRWRFVIPLVLLAGVAFSAMVWNNPVRQKRVLAWIHPEQYAEDTGFQAQQGLNALGAGGVTGRGLGSGRQKTFVPEQQTDFIMTVIGEELGVVASLGVVVLFAVFVICGLLVAWRARDPFGMYLACGITFLIGLQAFINLGVVTCLLPNKGLPLPFISKGGSNLLVLLSAVGILLSVARQAIEPERMPKTHNPFAEGTEPSVEIS